MPRLPETQRSVSVPDSIPASGSGWNTARTRSVYTCLDREGRVYSTDKSVWMQGRCARFFSYPAESAVFGLNGSPPRNPAGCETGWTSGEILTGLMLPDLLNKFRRDGRA